MPPTKLKLRLHSFRQVLLAMEMEIELLTPGIGRVLSQAAPHGGVTYTPIPSQYSTIGRLGLNRRVRNGNRCVLDTIDLIMFDFSTI